MVARRGTAKMVSRGIAWGIAFRFYDAPTQPAFRQIVDNDFADQKSREF